MEDRIVLPDAPVLVESIRSIGYSFETAVADVIDNSISAAATDIQVCFSSRNLQLCIKDNGCGMTEEELETAMRYGSQDPNNARRQDDLGRFGLGLKTASLSQCRKLTVISKRHGRITAACWDLDHIIQTGNWSLIFFSEDEIKDIPGYLFLNTNESGTVVLWQNFDRLQEESANVQKTFDEKIELTRKHVALVFHRFLNGEWGHNRRNISFNGEALAGVDPFLTRHTATQPLTEQVLRIEGKEIRVKPYILPFQSKLSAKDIKSLSGTGELRQQQGFYVYRNRRLIIWGTWFSLIKKDELGKLARVQVDIPNSLDSIWDIDVKKSRASLPSVIRSNLVNIVRKAVERSERVYEYRGRNVQTDKLIHIWNLVDDRGAFQYIVNRDSPVYKMLENYLDKKGQVLLDSFVKMLEYTFPYVDVYNRQAKNESTIKDKQPLDTDSVYEMAEKMINHLKFAGGDVQKFLRTLDKLDFFEKYPEVTAKIREEYSNE